MTVDDIRTRIEPIAPALAKLLEGNMKGVAIGALGQALLGDAAADIDGICGALDGNGNGADAVKDKVKDAEAAAFTQLSAAGGDLGKPQADELSPARETGGQADVTPPKQWGPSAARDGQSRAKDWGINSTLALLVTLGFFTVIAYILRNPMPHSESALAQTLLGVLGTSWVGIITFYFGSSIGSKEKTALLAERVPGKS